MIRNVCIIRLATCPLKLLGPYGCEWIETPNLDRLAAMGTVFDSHFVSGDFGQVHYAKNAIPFEEFNEEHLNQPRVEIAWNPFHDWQFEGVDLENQASRAEFFADVKAAMEEFDQECEVLLTLREHATLIFTAHLGLPLGEHGIFGIEHSRVHDELVRVPLIITHPNGQSAGQRIHDLTSHDSIEAILNGQPHIAHSKIITRHHGEMSLRIAGSCLMLPDANTDLKPLLFDFPDDRFEVNNLYDRSPDRVDDLKPLFVDRS